MYSALCTPNLLRMAPPLPSSVPPFQAVAPVLMYCCTREVRCMVINDEKVWARVIVVPPGRTFNLLSFVHTYQSNPNWG